MGPHRVGVLEQTLAEYLYVPAGRRHQGRENLEQGSLAPPVGTQESKDLSARDGKGNAGKSCTGAIQVAQVIDRHSRDRVHWPGFLLKIERLFRGEISAGVNR